LVEETLQLRKGPIEITIVLKSIVKRKENYTRIIIEAEETSRDGRSKRKGDGRAE
jgi:hypothetical protein